MSELKKLTKFASEDPKKMFAQIYRAMSDSLGLVANAAATKYMIATGKSGKSKLRGVQAPVDPERLTWRTGNLARSLVRIDDPYNIRRVEQTSEKTTGVTGTSIPYARMHELGGEIPGHEVTVTDKMRRFFWAKWYESNKEEEMWKWAAIMKKSAIEMPAVTMRARPFLSRAIQDASVRKQIGNLLVASFRADVVAALQGAIGVRA